MNLFINIFFSMLLSSSTLFLIFIVVMHFKEEIFSLRCQYCILKCSLLMAVLPIALTKSVIKYIAVQIMPPFMPQEFYLSGKIQAVMVTPNGFYTNVIFKNNMMITSIWFSVAVIIFVCYLYKSINFRKRVLKTVYEPLQPELEYFVEFYRKKLNIRRKIKIFIANTEVSPFTIGILQPIIIVPKFLEIENMELIIHHELCHVKSNDVLIRLIRIIAVGIYWFNPLIYMLNLYLENYCEFACDELVCEGLDKDSRKKYGILIINMASVKMSGVNSYSAPFSNDKKNIKKRMEFIMRRKKSSKLAMVLSIGMIMCGSFTAFAYEEPQSIILLDHSQEDVFVDSVNQTIHFKVKDKLNTHLIYDSQFTDINGNIYRIDEDYSTKKKCSHTFIDGEYEKHTKNKDGSCLAKVYNAKRCTKCGGFKIGSFLSETKYASCPH